MLTEDHFGLKVDGIDSAKALIESLFSVSATNHDSSYYGGAYLRFEWNDATGILYPNYHPAEREFTENEFRSFEMILVITSKSKVSADKSRALILDNVDSALIRRI